MYTTLKAKRIALDKGHIYCLPMILSVIEIDDKYDEILFYSFRLQKENENMTNSNDDGNNNKIPKYYLTLSHTAPKW